MLHHQQPLIGPKNGDAIASDAKISYGKSYPNAGGIRDRKCLPKNTIPKTLIMKCLDFLFGEGEYDTQLCKTFMIIQSPETSRQQSSDADLKQQRASIGEAGK